MMKTSFIPQSKEMLHPPLLLTWKACCKGKHVNHFESCFIKFGCKKLNSCLGSAHTMTSIFCILVERQPSLDDNKATEDSLRSSNK